MPLDPRYKGCLSTAYKLHAETTAAVTSVSPTSPVNRANDILDELLDTPSLTAAETIVECGGGNIDIGIGHQIFLTTNRTSAIIP